MLVFFVFVLYLYFTICPLRGTLNADFSMKLTKDQQQTKQLDDQTPLVDGIRRLDMSAKPKRVSWWLRPVMWIASFPVTWLHRTRIKKVNMEGVKRPYLLLCNHNAFYDFLLRGFMAFAANQNYIAG